MGVQLCHDAVGLSIHGADEGGWLRRGLRDGIGHRRLRDQCNGQAPIGRHRDASARQHTVTRHSTDSAHPLYVARVGVEGSDEGRRRVTRAGKLSGFRDI